MEDALGAASEGSSKVGMQRLHQAFDCFRSPPGLPVALDTSMFAAIAALQPITVTLDVRFRTLMCLTGTGDERSAHVVS